LEKTDPRTIRRSTQSKGRENPKRASNYIVERALEEIIRTFKFSLYFYQLIR